MHHARLCRHYFIDGDVVVSIVQMTILRPGSVSRSWYLNCNPFDYTRFLQ